MPKAITAPDMSTHAGSAENAAQRDENRETGKAAATVQSGAQGGVKREPRSLWRVILGLR
jgi:hypothetical protein